MPIFDERCFEFFNVHKLASFVLVPCRRECRSARSRVRLGGWPPPGLAADRKFVLRFGPRRSSGRRAPAVLDRSGLPGDDKPIIAAMRLKNVTAIWTASSTDSDATKGNISVPVKVIGNPDRSRAGYPLEP